MSEIKHTAIEKIPAAVRQGPGEYGYTRRKFVPFSAAAHTVVSVYEVAPGKAAYPYHFHHKSEETFYILSGEGVLKTPEGERAVRAGELLFFPTGPKGAHKLTNASRTEMLVYIDFDAVHDLDIAEYPDSGKIGIWGHGINQIYPQSAQADYYDGE